MASEGGQQGWQPISKNIFNQILDELLENQKIIWVAPFAEVGGYWMAQKVLENTKVNWGDE